MRARERGSRKRALDQLAPSVSTLLFAAHVALILFSTAALTTFLARPPAPWLLEEPSATIMRLGWQLSGPTYVVLGALAALVHAAGRVGARRAFLFFATASSIALGAELLGTVTDFPFGAYEYTALLGYRIGGRVPFPIPVSWFYMIYGSLAICGCVFASARDDGRTKLRWAFSAAVVLTAWDVAMDPAMVTTGHWVWETRGPFYGMPFSNWIGWLLTGTVVARVALAIVPPSRIARDISSSWLPIALYAVNGIMPVALCVRDGLWWAAILGAAVMLIPITLALVRGAPRRGVSTADSHTHIATVAAPAVGDGATRG